jgi:hypothetical protein
MPVLPHSFQDNVNQIASGVQVDENFDVLNTAVEALESAANIGPVSGRVERALNTPILASGTQNMIVTGDIQLEPTGGFGVGVTFKVGATTVCELFANEGIGHPIRLSFSFPVPKGAQWEAVAGAHAASLHSSYCPI